MIAIGKKPHIEKPLNVMVTSLNRTGRTEETIRRLDDLRHDGLVEKIVVLDSSPQSNMTEYATDVSHAIDTEFRRREFYDFEPTLPNTLESIPGQIGYDQFVGDVKYLVDIEDIDMVIPTSDAGAYALSTELPSNKRVPQDFDVVSLFQDKGHTYDFVSRNSVGRTPSYIPIDPTLPQRSYQQIKDFIDSHEGQTFAKPRRPLVGGSQGVGKISSLDDLKNLVSGNVNLGSYLLSQELYPNEVNHTVILNQDGSVNSQASYVTINDAIDGKPSRVSMSDRELEGFGYRLGSALKKEFPLSAIRGVYNIDFLRNTEGSFVLSEINVGRLPANFGVFGKDYNILRPILDSFKGDSNRYDILPPQGEVYTKSA